MLARQQLPGVVKVGRRRVLVKRRELVKWLDRNSQPSREE
jgi:hypothetical protein